MDNIISKESHITKIDVLRAIAILLVFIFHSQLVLSSTLSLQNDGFSLFRIIRYLFSFGWSGVELFLLISGFLIHYNFLQKKEIFNTSTFYSKRFWRIYPPYFIILLFFCFNNHILYYFKNPDGMWDFLSHLFLVHNFSNKTFFSINASFWSLALELQLYIIYPLFLYIRKKVGINISSISILLLSFLFTLIRYFFLKQMDENAAYDSSVVRLWFVWVAGAFFAEKYFNKKSIFYKKHVYWLVIAIILVIISNNYVVTKPFLIYWVTLVWLVFFEWFLVAGFSIGKKLTKFLSLIGLCSYSIYLIHQPLLSPLFLYLYSFSGSNYAAYFKIFPAFIIIFLISYSFYYFIERYSIILGGHIRNSKKKAYANFQKQKV